MLGKRGKVYYIKYRINQLTYFRLPSHNYQDNYLIEEHMHVIEKGKGSIRKDRLSLFYVFCSITVI